MINLRYCVEVTALKIDGNLSGTGVVTIDCKPGEVDAVAERILKAVKEIKEDYK